MDFNGLFKPYPANRPLTDAERERRLLRRQRLEVEPAYQLSVIRMNSTFMELVDKHFAWKGFLTSVALMGFTLVAFMLIGIALVDTPEGIESKWLVFSVTSVMSLLPGGLSAWFFKQDNFRFTHYPIRLNRKTRMVHVFRINGTVLSVPWDEVFFCIAALPQCNWEIQGHVLDKNGVTVKETFAFMLHGTGDADRDLLVHYWEFVRRYMEDGPNSVAKHVKYCLPIVDKKESFAFALQRAHFEVGALSILIQIPFLLMYLAIYPGRWLAMRTCKIPVWPDEIERVCPIDANDPYRRDASTNEKR